MTRHRDTESQRIRVQQELEIASTHAQRNKLGHFATPPELALEILRYAAERTAPTEKINFLDPGIGTGAFYSALLSTVPREKIHSGHGYEIHPELADAARNLWTKEGLSVRHEDFTTAEPPNPDSRFNLNQSQGGMCIC